MKNFIIPDRYAKALISLARDKDLIDKVGEDLNKIIGVIKSSAELTGVLSDPVLDRKKKELILTDIIERTNISSVTGNFLKILLHKNRFDYIESIAESYKNLSLKLKKKKIVLVETAFELGSKTIEKLRKKLMNRFKQDILLETKVAPELIGGLKVNVDGDLYDGTVINYLNNIRKRLL